MGTGPKAQSGYDIALTEIATGSVPAFLVDKLDDTLSILQMKKRDFIEMALSDALERAARIIDDVGAFSRLQEERALEEKRAAEERAA